MEQRARRLYHLANNLRFLILPGIGLPQLASKVLALCLHRLLRNLAITLLRLSGREKIAESLRDSSWKPSRALSFLGF